MKTQLMSMYRWLSAVVYWLFSHPQRVRLIVAAVIICLALIVLCVPSLTTLADPMAGVGH